MHTTQRDTAPRSVGGIQRRPRGIVASICLRVVSAGGPSLRVADALGETARVVVAPDIDDLDWQETAWYRFEHLYCVPTADADAPVCHACSEPMSPADAELRGLRDECQSTASLPTGIATSKSAVTPLPADAWLPEESDPHTEPMSWQCSTCHRRLETGTADTPDSARHSLPDRLRAALTGDGSPAGDRAPATHYTESFRDALRAGTVPDQAQLDTRTAYAPYRFGPAAIDPSGIASVSPTVDTAATMHPVTREQDRYVEVCPRARTFDWSRERPQLDLVLAIDISGSMGASLDPDGASKLTAVTEALTDFTQRLSDGDRLGVVVFDSTSRVLKPLAPVTESTHDRLGAALGTLRPAGGTDIVGGHRHARTLYERGTTRQEPAVERRIIVVSDSLPAMGPGTVSQFETAATAARDAAINTSVVGLDLMTTQATSKFGTTPGSNLAYAPTEEALARLFRRRVDSILFPVAFDFRIDIDPGEAVREIAPESTAGGTFQRRTLFPAGPTLQSLRSVLLTVGHEPIEVTVSWTDRQGTRQQTTRRVDWSDTSTETFASDDQRLRIALQRYLAGLRQWRRTQASAESTDTMPAARTQLELLAQSLETERAATGASQLRQEIDILRELQSD